MIEGLLPSNAHVVETFADLLDIRLFPEEQAVIRNAVTKRRRELITVRVSAKESVYKAWFPLTSRSLDFTGATVTVNPRQATLLPGHTSRARSSTVNGRPVSTAAGSSATASS
jgi:4'-phosphopantetheinyl transferase EntD